MNVEIRPRNETVEAVKPFFVLRSGWLLRVFGGKGFLEDGLVSWVKTERCCGVPHVCLDAARRGFFRAVEALPRFSCVIVCLAAIGFLCVSIGKCCAPSP